LNKLVEAEGFEKFLDVRFTGTKRFGLDGGESLVPALEQIIKRGGSLGVQEIVFGMAPSRPFECVDPSDGQAASRAVP
jgi:2-oxoglutarate dehydrogenase E1 component